MQFNALYSEQSGEQGEKLEWKGGVCLDRYLGYYHPSRVVKGVVLSMVKVQYGVDVKVADQSKKDSEDEDCDIDQDRIVTGIRLHFLINSKEK